MDTIKIEKKNTLMVAHRGVSGLEKENTLGRLRRRGQPQLLRRRDRRAQNRGRQVRRHPRLGHGPRLAAACGD